jgi:hypothetical protein
LIVSPLARVFFPIVLMPYAAASPVGRHPAFSRHTRTSKKYNLLIIVRIDHTVLPHFYGCIISILFLKVNPMAKIHRLKKTRACCGLRVAGLRGRALKNCDKKTTPKFFTSQLETRNSQPSPPRSKKLAVDSGWHVLSPPSNFSHKGTQRDTKKKRVSRPSQ